MLKDMETWIFYSEDVRGNKYDLGALTLDASKITVVPISQYIDLRDGKGETFATITWPSATKVRKAGA